MIRGKQVELRPIEDGDAPLLLRWQNQPEVWRSTDSERPFSLADIRHDIDRSRRDGYVFVVTVEGRPVGRLELNRGEPRNRTCSVSVYIGEADCWGRGYARDALMTMLGYAFDRLDLHLVHLRTLAANGPLIRMYERCGFVREAELRDRSWRDGRWIGHVEMSVARDEFVRIRERWDSEAR